MTRLALLLSLLLLTALCNHATAAQPSPEMSDTGHSPYRLPAKPLRELCAAHPVSSRVPPDPAAVEAENRVKVDKLLQW